jgi:hypothetical protein
MSDLYTNHEEVVMEPATQYEGMINLTHILNSELSERVFNPAIVWLYGNKFLCAYRTFSRYPSIDIEPMEELYFDPQHPWAGGAGAKTWWDKYKGYDQTRFCLLKIKGDSITVKKRYILQLPSVDVRLFRVSGTGVLFIGNEVDATTKFREELDCTKQKCFIQKIGLVHIGDELSVLKELFLCTDIAKYTEKNWSLWAENDNLLFSYNVVPSHQVFTINSDLECTSVKSINGRSEMLDELVAYYKRILHVSLSTPAFPFTSTTNFGIGHIKYEHEKVGSIDAGSPLAIFNETIKKKYAHPKFVYLMYVYEFSNKRPYDITRVSNFFAPNNAYSLVFATNLTFDEPNDRYILSYGDHDSECWMLYLTKEEIESVLTVKKNPTDFKFGTSF